MSSAASCPTSGPPGDVDAPSDGPPKPLVTVIIPVLDGADHLAAQLDSLVGQRGAPRFEVVVCDNGSHDRSIEIARSYEGRLDVRLVDAAARRGQTFARNRGAAAARADLLLFLDQDDVTDPGYVGALAHGLAHQEFVAARMETGRLNPGAGADVRNVAQTAGLGTKPAPWGYGCTLGIRKATFEALGGFSEDLYVSGEDVDLCLRAAQQGIQLRWVPEAILHYRFPVGGWALFRQGRRYGIGYDFVLARRRMARAGLPTLFRNLAGPLRLLVWPGAAGSRSHALFLLGRRIGMLEGRIRWRGVANR